MALTELGFNCGGVPTSMATANFFHLTFESRGTRRARNMPLGFKAGLLIVMKF